MVYLSKNQVNISKFSLFFLRLLSTLTFESGHPVALLPIYYCYSTYCLLQKLSKYLLTTYLLLKNLLHSQYDTSCFHRQHSLNLPKAVLSLSLLSFEKWPKKVSKMATILLLLLLADATTYCAKKNWI